MNLRILGSLVSAFLVSGCVVDDAPLTLGNIRPLGLPETCWVTDDENVFQPRGRLDVAGGGPFYGVVEVMSQLGEVNQSGSAPSSTVVSEDANAVILDTIDVDYSSDPDLGLPNQTEPYYGVLDPGSRENLLTIPFIPPSVSDTLRTALVPGDQVILMVGARFTGRTRSGTAISTNRIEYPIILTHSGTTCAEYARNNPCGGGTVGGMPGVPVQCVMATP